MSRYPPESPSPLSRAEAEKLCLLHAIGRRGATALDLASRLGLSTTLAAAMGQATFHAQLEGLVAADEDRFALTDAGREHLAARLEALGFTAFAAA